MERGICFIKKLSTHILHLNQVLEETEQILSIAPPGNLRIRKRGNSFQYHHVLNQSHPNGIYLPKKKKETLIRALAQKDYCRRLQKALKSQIQLCEHFMKNYDKNGPATVFSHMNSYRQPLISPLLISNEEYKRMWESEKYTPRDIVSDEIGYITNRGETVRSKSELIIANLLYENNIPYRYECPLVIDPTLTIYPDFTILIPSTREIIYLEHFGMMDIPEYLNSFLQKIRTLSHKGIVVGQNLFVLFESNTYHLDTRDVMAVINAIKERDCTIIG